MAFSPVLVALWIILGLLAFIVSIVCFGGHGSLLQNVIGLLLAILFGPFYFIYYFVMKANNQYCDNLGKVGFLGV